MAASKASPNLSCETSSAFSEEHEVAGRGDGQELREPLDDAQYRGLQQVGHCSLQSNRRQRNL